MDDDGVQETNPSEREHSKEWGNDWSAMEMDYTDGLVNHIFIIKHSVSL